MNERSSSRPLRYDVTRRAATEFAFSGALYDQHAPGLASIAATRFSIQGRNSNPARAGRAFGTQSPRKMCARKKISARACCERKSNAPCATPIGGMFLQTDPGRQAFATVWIRRRCDSSPGKQAL